MHSNEKCEYIVRIKNVLNCFLLTCTLERHIFLKRIETIWVLRNSLFVLARFWKQLKNWIRSSKYTPIIGFCFLQKETLVCCAKAALNEVSFTEFLGFVSKVTSSVGETSQSYSSFSDLTYLPMWNKVTNKTKQKNIKPCETGVFSGQMDNEQQEKSCASRVQRCSFRFVSCCKFGLQVQPDNICHSFKPAWNLYNGNYRWNKFFRCIFLVTTQKRLCKLYSVCRNLCLHVCTSEFKASLQYLDDVQLRVTFKTRLCP